MKDPRPTAARRATVRCLFCLTLNRVDLGRAADRPRCGDCARPILLDRPLKVEGEVPVLVDVYADWCGPCKAMAPDLDEVSRARAGELLVAKLDTDRNPEAARRFGIGGVPTLILFWNGEEADRITGAAPRAHVEALLENRSDNGRG